MTPEGRSRSSTTICTFPLVLGDIKTDFDRRQSEDASLTTGSDQGRGIEQLRPGVPPGSSGHRLGQQSSELPLIFDHRLSRSGSNWLPLVSVVPSYQNPTRNICAAAALTSGHYKSLCSPHKIV